MEHYNTVNEDKSKFNDQSPREKQINSFTWWPVMRIAAHVNKPATVWQAVVCKNGWVL